ncbi:MAG: NAD(P)H-binding protein [Ferruginibacter sp.]
MKVIVFGATGMVGKQLVKQALFNGYSVKAFGRNVFTEFDTEEKGLELIKGALFDEKEVLDAIKGCDAVLSALGGSMDGSDKTRTLGMKNIIAQMKKAGVKRIVAVGGFGVLNADEISLLIDQDNYPKEYLAVGMEHKQAYEYLNESGLDWTFVCCPDIINHEATGSFVTNASYPPQPNNFKIYSGDLALFMLGEIKKNEYIKERVGISN